MSDHTPAPWISDHITEDGDIDCGMWVVQLPPDREASTRRLYFGDMEANTGRDIANANLVAAAPELLAALEDFLMYPEVYTGISADVYRQAAAAVTKARGQS